MLADCCAAAAEDDPVQPRGGALGPEGAHSPWPALTAQHVHAMMLGLVTCRRSALAAAGGPIARIIHAVLPDMCTPNMAAATVLGIIGTDAETRAFVHTVLCLGLAGAWPGAINRPHRRRRSRAAIEAHARTLLAHPHARMIVVWAIREALYETLTHGLPHIAAVLADSTHWDAMGRNAQDTMDIVRASPRAAAPANVHTLIDRMSRIAKRRMWMRRNSSTLAAIVNGVWATHINKFDVARYAASPEMLVLRTVVASIPVGAHCTPAVLRLFGVPDSVISLVAYAMYQAHIGMSNSAIAATFTPLVEEFDTQTVTRAFMFIVLVDARDQYAVHDLRGITVHAPPGATLHDTLPLYIAQALPPGATAVTVPQLHSALLRRMFCLSATDPLPPTPLYVPYCVMCASACIPDESKPYKLGSEYVIMYTGTSFVPHACSCGLRARMRRGGGKNRPTATSNPSINRRWFTERRHDAHAAMQCEHLPMWGHAVLLREGGLLQLCWMCGRRATVKSLAPWAVCSMCESVRHTARPPPHLWFASCTMCHTTSNGGRPMNGVTLADAPERHVRLCSTCFTKALIVSTPVDGGDGGNDTGRAAIRITIDATPLRDALRPPSLEDVRLRRIMAVQAPPATTKKRRTAPAAPLTETGPHAQDLCVLTVQAATPEDMRVQAPENTVFTGTADICVACRAHTPTVCARNAVSGRVVRLCAHCVVTVLCTPQECPLIAPILHGADRIVLLDNTQRAPLCTVRAVRPGVPNSVYACPAPPGEATQRTCVVCATRVSQSGAQPQGRYVNHEGQFYLHCARCLLKQITRVYSTEASHETRSLMSQLVVNTRGVPERIMSVSVRSAAVDPPIRRFALPHTTAFLVNMFLSEAHTIASIIARPSTSSDSTLLSERSVADTLSVLHAISTPYKP